MNSREKVLLYLASGEYHPSYEKLPYDKVILVDKALRADEPKPHINSKVEIINKEILVAIKKLKIRDVKIDCLVSVNEGLAEGGGLYPVFSEFLLGYLYPILSDKLIVIMDLSYYSSFKIKSKIKKFDWGYKLIKRIENSDQNYIHPSFFKRDLNTNLYDADKSPGDVFYLAKSSKYNSFTINHTKVNVFHKSIFCDASKLCAIGLNYPKDNIEETRNSYVDYVSKFFYSHKKVFSIRGKSIDEIIELCEKEEFHHLGLVPWLNDAYEKVIHKLKRADFLYPKTISFYHLNRNDFKILYNYSANQ